MLRVHKDCAVKVFSPASLLFQKSSNICCALGPPRDSQEVFAVCREMHLNLPVASDEISLMYFSHCRVHFDACCCFSPNRNFVRDVQCAIQTGSGKHEHVRIEVIPLMPVYYLAAAHIGAFTGHGF